MGMHKAFNDDYSGRVVPEPNIFDDKNLRGMAYNEGVRRNAKDVPSYLMGWHDALNTARKGCEHAHAKAFFFRPHRGTLADSMAGCKQFYGFDHLKAFLLSDLVRWGLNKNPEDITCEKYGEVGVDDRVGWDTHIIFIKDYGVAGFTDKDVNDLPR